MKIVSKVRQDKIKEVIIKIPRALGEHAFLSFFGLLFISLILGAFIFYKYDILTKKEKIEIVINHLNLKKDECQRILKEQEEREKRFKEAEFKEYCSFRSDSVGNEMKDCQNPFQKPGLNPVSTSSNATSAEDLLR